MTNKKRYTPEQLRRVMDKIIREQNSIVGVDKILNQDYISVLKQIRDSLQPPSDELVGDIVEMVLVHVYMENDRFRVDPDVKPIIRKLLGEK